MIRVAAGSAGVLGLSRIRMDARPTTAHLMTPGRCVHDCKFCTQAAGSRADQGLLSRISWPLFDDETVYSALRENQDRFRRVCLQVVHSEEPNGYLDYVQRIRSACTLPLSVDVKAADIREVVETFEAGADVVGLPLDAADPGLFSDIKNGSFDATVALIKSSAGKFPGRISTHIIIGLGEAENQVVELMEELYCSGVTVGLFAFTPVPGTRMALEQQPDLGQYRRLQMARFLIFAGREPHFSFNEKGQISGFGYTGAELMGLVTPSAFRTSGCSDCNRPYYNERPGGILYNYPVEPSDREFTSAMNLALELTEGGND